MSNHKLVVGGNAYYYDRMDENDAAVNQIDQPDQGGTEPAANGSVPTERIVFHDYPESSVKPVSEGGHLHGEHKNIIFDPSKRSSAASETKTEEDLKFRYLADVAKSLLDAETEKQDAQRDLQELKETQKMQRRLQARRFAKFNKEGRIDLKTQAKNSNAFQLEFPEIVERANAEHRPLAIIYGDLDRLKTLNDQHGHAKGDEALSLVVEEARKHIRPSDHVYRVGGDEFIIVMEDFMEDMPEDSPPSDQYVSLRAQDIQEAIVQAMRAEGLPVDELKLGISMAGGVYTPGESWKEFEERVDKIMLHRKKHHKLLSQTADPKKQGGFIPLLIALLTVVVLVIVLAYLRVSQAHR